MDDPSNPAANPAASPAANPEELTGGNAGGPVVRIADTVRKAWSASTPSVVAFVEVLRSRGVDVPEPRGRDADGRQVQEFVAGPLAMDRDPLSLDELARVGALVRDIHDAAATFIAPADAVWETAIPAPGSDLVCHNDLAPWNLVTGERWVFIDWDAAAPSTRLWDLAYAAQAFTLNDPAEPVEAAAARLRAFVEGYGADDDLRAALPGAMGERTAAMYQLLESGHRNGVDPWGAMFASGHGAHWAAVHAHVERHRSDWVRVLV